MSPALLHYTQRGIIWECGTFFTREDGYSFRTDPLIKGIVIKPDLTGVGDFFVWNSLVEVYTQRALIVSTDKLPAIAGLAELFHNKHPNTHLAGIWAEDLLRSL